MDSIEVTIVPVVLGGGIPLVPPGGPRATLRLAGTKTYASGMITLAYEPANAES